jgi:hypothetical protein
VLAVSTGEPSGDLIPVELDGVTYHGSFLVAVGEVTRRSMNTRRTHNRTRF